MRKIIPKSVEEKRARRNKILLGGFLIFIMFFSVIEYSFLNFNSGNGSQNPNNVTKIEYNGFEFTEKNGFWLLNKDGNSFIFSYNPEEIENYDFNAKKLEDYKNKILYIKIDDISSESEIRANLGQFVNGISAVENENCEQNTILIKESNGSKIYADKNCVFIEGKKQDLTKITDWFLFKLLEIAN